MPHELRFRPAALADLEDIFHYILRISANPAVARGYVERIRVRCQRIATLPHAGRPRDDLAKGLRSIAFERRVVIVYRVIGDTVEITNIFYGGRDYAALYRQGDPDDET
jgi:toxin ParE1/3/4